MRLIQPGRIEPLYERLRQIKAAAGALRGNAAWRSRCLGSLRPLKAEKP
jgi:hypothetical protein